MEVPLAMRGKESGTVGTKNFGWLYDDLMPGAVRDMNTLVFVTSPKHPLHRVTSPHLRFTVALTKFTLLSSVSKHF